MHIHAAGCARHPAEAMVCGIPPGRAHSRMQADSVYMCSSPEFAVGILVLGIAGSARRQHAFRWAAASPFGLVSRAAQRDTIGGSA
jgi:hypothetical protein